MPVPSVQFKWKYSKNVTLRMCYPAWLLISHKVLMKLQKVMTIDVETVERNKGKMYATYIYKNKRAKVET